VTLYFKICKNSLILNIFFRKSYSNFDTSTAQKGDSKQCLWYLWHGVVSNGVYVKILNIVYQYQYMYTKL